MISPYVRRLRLGREIETRRRAKKLTHAQLSKLTGDDRSKFSRLEGGKMRPDLDFAYRLLDALGVEGEEWTQLAVIAREATERGWWEGYAAEMGERQAKYADLEAGANTIREYQTFIPGLLQTEEFTQAVTQFDDLNLSGGGRAVPDSVMRARARRQRMLRRPDGPTYEVIMDELVARRPTAPERILAAQLRHLARVNDDQVLLRVLPIAARIEGYTAPSSAFSLYTYPDPGDPVIAAVDTVTADLVLSEDDQVKPYDQLFDRLRRAALSPTDSAELLARAADELEGSSR